MRNSRRRRIVVSSRVSSVGLVMGGWGMDRLDSSVILAGRRARGIMFHLHISRFDHITVGINTTHTAMMATNREEDEGKHEEYPMEINQQFIQAKS